VTDKKKSYWNQPATKDDVYLATAVTVGAIMLGLVIGFAFLI
jgi:hypothetical protein